MLRALRPLTVAGSVLLLAAFLGGCDKPVEKESRPAPKLDQDTIEFPKGSPQLAAIITAPVRPRGDMSVRLNGRVVWNEERTVRVMPPLAGRVLEIAASAGDRVAAGQVLAVMAAPELGQAQSDARKAEQDRALARQNLTRIEELHAAGVSPTKDLQAAQADFARAESELARAEARLRTYGAQAGAVDQRFSLRSPIAGVVVERNLNPGQELRPDQPADKAPFVVSDPSRLWFVLDVAEADVGVLKTGIDVSLRSPLLGSETASGRITHIADFVDPQTRTVKARGTVDNKDRRLKAEMFVTADVKLAKAAGLVVPTNAVYLRGDRHFVFVQTGAETYARRHVQIGAAFNTSQVVLDGVKEDDKVVVDGALLLQRMLAVAGYR